MILPYTQEELLDIEKHRELNDKQDNFLKDERDNWNAKIKPLYDMLKDDFRNPTTVRQLIQAQADCLNYRQSINDQINLYLNIRSEKDVKRKMVSAEKMVYYKTNFGIKPSTFGELNTLVDASIAEYIRGIELIETYITFLRDTLKCLESFTYTIKNIVELLNYLDGK